MATFIATCEDLVIALSGTTTRWVNTNAETSDAVRLAIGAPAALDVGTYTIQVSIDGINVHSVLNDGTDDILLPAASKSCQYETFVAPYWRLLGPTAAASRTFKLTKLYNAY